MFSRIPSLGNFGSVAPAADMNVATGAGGIEGQGPAEPVASRLPLRPYNVSASASLQSPAKPSNQSPSGREVRPRRRLCTSGVGGFRSVSPGLFRFGPLMIIGGESRTRAVACLSPPSTCSSPSSRYRRAQGPHRTLSSSLSRLPPPPPAPPAACDTSSLVTPRRPATSAAGGAPGASPRTGGFSPYVDDFSYARQADDDSIKARDLISDPRALPTALPVFWDARRAAICRFALPRPTFSRPFSFHSRQPGGCPRAADEHAGARVVCSHLRQRVPASAK